MRVFHLSDHPNMKDVLYNIEADSFEFFKYAVASETLQHRKYILVEHGIKVIGICCFNPCTFKAENALGLAYIETHKDFKNQGVSKLLVCALFDYAKVSEKRIAIGWYEPEGELYLRHQMEKFSSVTGVEIF